MLAATVGAAALISHAAYAGDLDGEDALVGPGEAPEYWRVENGSNLTIIHGGQSYNIIARNDSTISLNGANVVRAPWQSGSALIGLINGSTASIVASTIYNDAGPGLVVGNVPASPGEGESSYAYIEGSSITAMGRAASIASGSTMDVVGSHLVGWAHPGSTGYGISLTNGFVNVRGGSDITGETSGIRLVRGGSDTVSDKGRTLLVDGSHVEGLTGAAIVVMSSEENPTDATIVVQNRSTLVGGNGRILEVGANASTSFTVDNSELVGDVVVEEGGHANVTLRNYASLKGRMTGVENLHLNAFGNWQMVESSAIKNIIMDRGQITLSDGSAGFNTLTVENLSGSGTFKMNTDIANDQGDLLRVTGNAAGAHTLHVKNTGIDPTSVGDPHLVVETAGGDAIFGLLGGAVDLGVYKYLLNKSGDNWYLQETSYVTPGTATAIGLHGVAPTVWYGELATLRQRMGDVRNNRGDGGLWARTYGRGFQISAGAGQTYDQTQWGMSVGADRSFNLGDSDVLVGVMGGYSNSSVKLEGGSRGDVDSYYGGLYGTWLASNGLYVDSLFKLNRFEDAAHVRMSDGSGAEGNYGATGIGGQIEVGKHIALANEVYVEPFAQLAGVNVGSSNYWLDNGMHVQNGAMDSLIGRLGATIGINYEMANGSKVQPYMRLAVAQEFAGGNDLLINSTAFSNDMKGTRGEIGVGFAAQVAEKVQIHGEFDYADGKNLKQNWGLNLGLRYAF
ncbi:autotransporter outer membrane beta-barrel domain-containing protein [Mesorhizobium sp. NBSH29]|uniref:autotransporter outer membrane beta-barrel domain-containing protein n=1 Tax=Mesorhizobium sp. NBSH29 TaxID=2654249 RepID=UPI0018969DA0|nr:autotransporter outer membrane beta-barrel domain-containing protein [Mesorhizobium sp. NBSH29]